MREITVLDLDLKKPETFGNVAEKLTEDDRRILANDLLELIAIDDSSMSDWLLEAQGYLDKLDSEDSGNATPQNREQEGSGEEPPPATELTLGAVIQFSARATDALLGEPDLARSSEEGGEKLASWVSSQVRTNDPNWILDTDPLVVHMAATGLAWRKRSFDEVEKAFHTEWLPCTRVKINKNVRSVERAPRITDEFERYPYEIQRAIKRKNWISYGPVFDEADPQAPKNFAECDCWLDLDGDGVDEPWTVVISKDDVAEVVKIKPRWSRKTVVDDDEKLFFNPIHRFYPYRLLPDPKGGFFPMGFGKLLNRVEGSADRLLAAIIDTAESSASDGGVLGGSSFGLPDKIELKTNRVNVLPTDGRPLSDTFSQFPTKQVSPSSVQILDKIITLADRLAGTLNLLENAPASMSATMAKGIIDSSGQVQSAVHRRLVAMLTQEFRMFVVMADAYEMLPSGVSPSDGNGVAVTADPQLATEMQRSALAGIYMELMKDPMTKWDEVRMRLYKCLRLPNPEKLLGQPPQPQATPHEKMQGMIGMLKQRNENIKVIGAVAQQLTQAVLNMVQASGGMQDQRLGLLQMAQLEHAVQQMMQESADVSSTIDGMVGQSGNQAAAQLPAPAPAGGGVPIPGGQASGPPDAGQGSGPS
jgi:hypothetical protein